MTTIRTIITDGLRESGLIGVGEDAEGAVFDEALRRFNVLIRGLFGNELGEKLTNVSFGYAGLTNAYAILEDSSDDIIETYVSPNIRLMLNINTPYTLYLPPNPEDGARLGVVDVKGNLATYAVTINGNGRHIELASTVTLNTNSLNREWFYRADLGSWSRVTDLEAEDESPLPLEFDDLFTTMLAIRLNPRYGGNTSEELVETFKRAKKMFRSRYRQTVEKASENGLLFLPSSTWWRAPRTA